jgi:hypothetical protein
MLLAFVVALNALRHGIIGLNTPTRSLHPPARLDVADPALEGRCHPERSEGSLPAFGMT